MISIPYVFIAGILIVIWSSYRFIVLKKMQKKNMKREIVVNVFFIYFLVVIGLTICKRAMLEFSFYHSFHTNYIPLVETIKMFKNNTMGIGYGFYNVIGNILLFMPLGFFIPLLFQRKNNVRAVAKYGFITSLTIEIIQFFTAINLTDVDDLIFNTLGTILGLGIFNLFNNLVKNTKVEKLIASITSTFHGGLVKLILKPLSIMIGIVTIFSAAMVYNSTMSGDLSNEEIAREVFKYRPNKDFVVEKEVLGYKLFLKDEGTYIDLISVKKVFNNRWDKNGIGSQFEKMRGDYDIRTIHEENSVGVLVYGKNKGASKIEIKFNGKSYVEELKLEKYFIVAFPSFEALDKNTDMYNVFNGKESKDLSIKLYDAQGREYNEMKQRE
ncbi:glycopeptide antibiotics resistance protein [Clostridium punense]|uniref:Glycopeptide antibiotics resistance protein n=1 Tax=Clostridium punense TaxID=1054297 RepID=A0ABS4KAP4_9CLOT|nr:MULTISPECIES: VanZ family protein [Clostridium]EQB87226.1 hypothetical protein M918_10240 [Clostridium sp. BL8]MBP2023689.1 glycopeptide antibiotics resistance protein [Clostridium punense]